MARSSLWQEFRVFYWEHQRLRYYAFLSDVDLGHAFLYWVAKKAATYN